MTVAVAVGRERVHRIAPAVDALRAIGWRHVRAALLFGVVAWAFSMLMELPTILRFVTPLHVIMARGVLDFEVRALCLMVALVIADRLIDEGAGRLLTYAVAALAGCLAGVLLGLALDANWAQIEMAARDPNAPGAPPWQRYGTQVTNTIFAMLNWLLFGGSAAFLYADRRAARKTEELLRAAEIDRLGRSKLALESRLQAMQARVEPQFLFNTLAHVRDLYERDPAAAARMLDDLIAYLRAAMPRMRDTSSTVGQEIELARAWLGIVGLRLPDRFSVDIAVEARVEAMRMPPMMLLPLLDRLVAPGLDLASGDAALRIRCSGADGDLRLSISSIGFRSPPEAAWAEIRRRLDALYGGDASLELERTERCGARATLTIPCERGERADR
ncbi:MAG TPA: histidine kinase [Casimicrobiaceae bacterium]